MQEPAPTDAQTAGDPRADIAGGVCWMALGCVILLLSWRMDRLESQDINPYTIPGLVPGLLGLGMIALGGIMLWRGWVAGGLGHPALPRPALDWGRFGLVLLLCIGFVAVLLGRVPFVVAASLFVTASIALLRWREFAGRRLRGFGQSAVIGIGAGVAVYLVFERLFLVRLP